MSSSLNSLTKHLAVASSLSSSQSPPPSIPTNSIESIQSIPIQPPPPIPTNSIEYTQLIPIPPFKLIQSP
ncbi:hypothetical protein RhiirC2_796934 [Rhizophagus irregularis]|uniref:Uncharacterized protein n=1 Tax=Rhizophagus irregularis TaxID=588596 RepID=A0A2N1M8V0_9GLOM|nr:hypothetical protein RhiirC2_796934 [Rhizophagus irregularis]